MHYRNLLFLAIFLADGLEASCSFRSSPVVLKSNYPLIQVWNDEEQELLSSPFIEDGTALASYRVYVRSEVVPDQISLLQRQRVLFLKAFGRAGVVRFDRLLDKSLGRIEPAACLESLLLDAHLRAHGKKGYKTEFQAAVLQHASSGKLKIYFLSGLSIGAPAIDPVLDLLSKDVADGWEMVFHLHNHPFLFNNLGGDIAGTVVPSDGDVGVYSKLRSAFMLQQAWITNGFDTLRVDHTQFHLLQ
jgi:hypothetical protein